MYQRMRPVGMILFESTKLHNLRFTYPLSWLPSLCLWLCQAFLAEEPLYLLLPMFNFVSLDTCNAYFLKFSGSFSNDILPAPTKRIPNHILNCIYPHSFPSIHNSFPVYIIYFKFVHSPTYTTMKTMCRNFVCAVHWIPSI